MADKQPLTRPHSGKRWRTVMKIHQACEMFPQLPPDELRALGKDIAKNGLLEPITVAARNGLAHVKEFAAGRMVLLDGRNRLDAMELVGLNPFTASGNPSMHLAKKWQTLSQATHGRNSDPWSYVASVNILRRHLDQAQKQDLVDRLLIANPERSNRATAELADVTGPTVALRRTKLENKGAIPKLAATIGRDQRKRTTTPRKTKASTPVPETSPELPPVTETELPASPPSDQPLEVTPHVPAEAALPQTLSWQTLIERYGLDEVLWVFTEGLQGLDTKDAEVDEIWLKHRHNLMTALQMVVADEDWMHETLDDNVERWNAEAEAESKLRDAG